MDVIEELVKRNHTFATTDFKKGLGFKPSLGTIVISCVDPRVDPAHILGLEQGEVVVIRNLGGRFVPSTLQTVGMLRKLAQSEGMAAGPGWNIILLHHTDCGMAHLGDAPDMLASYFGVKTDELESLAIADPYASVRVDVETVKANPRMPAEFLVSGLVYDVYTGSVEVVVPPAPLRDEAA